MKYILPFVLVVMLCTSKIYGQGMAVNTSGVAAAPSAIFDASSITQGVLFPRMDSAQRVAISAPATGLLVYQTNGQYPGYYFYNGLNWVLLNSSSAGPSGLSNIKAKVTYQVPSGTGGGSAVAGAWTTRPLNNIVYDDIGITLASDQIALPVGNYEVSAYCVFNNANFLVGNEKIRIRNMTAGTTIGISLNSAMSVAANYSCYPAMLHDERFTLSSPSNIALQYFMDGGVFGSNFLNAGQDEVYAEVIITKL